MFLCFLGSGFTSEEEIKCSKKEFEMGPQKGGQCRMLASFLLGCCLPTKKPHLRALELSSCGLTNVNAEYHGHMFNSVALCGLVG